MNNWRSCRLGLRCARRYSRFLHWEGQPGRQETGRLGQLALEFRDLPGQPDLAPLARQELVPQAPRELALLVPRDLLAQAQRVRLAALERSDLLDLPGPGQSRS
jgi:hypothetical protein